MSIQFFQRISAAVKQAQESWRNTRFSHEGDWQEGDINPDVASEASKGASILQHYAPSGAVLPGRPDLDFDPEQFTKQAESFEEGKSINYKWFMDKVAMGEAKVAMAYVFEGRFNHSGKLLKEGSKPFRIVPVYGHENYMKKVEQTQQAINKLGESMKGKRGTMKEDTWGWNQGQFDPNQYTEYAPLLGGYFYAQMYLTDMLKQMAYSFEAWNHNPLAHRIINAMAQYTLGRRFDWRMNKKAKDFDKKEKLWEDFAKVNNLRQRISKYWIREKHIFGELMINKKTMQSIHPATVWEIVTDPSDISDVYYYYRSYPTQWQMFTGFSAGGGKNVKSSDYIVEQIPYKQVLHMKSNCTSFEKRGRSTLFSTLGWLKRVKDLYNAQVTREQMLADYAWDVTIKGGANDVSSFISTYGSIPKGSGNQFVHNEAVTRQAISAGEGAAGRGQSATSDNLLAFIATSVGFPKDFFNVIATGGGNRATALVAAEPFTKVIEDDQSDMEFLLQQLFQHVVEKAGLEYDDEDIEFTFPSVTKDTTSEAVKNITLGETQGYISKETAGGLYAQEMGVTTYDYEDQQKQMKKENDRGDMTGAPMGMGRFGPDGQVTGDDSPIHGNGAVDTKSQMGNL